jgi:hypothetical protein
VSAIADGLDWEIGRGKQARHFFALSPNGEFRLRKLTEQWRAAGPPADDVWEYVPSRPPRQPGTAIVYAGRSMLVEELVVAWDVDEAHERLNLEVYHPAFGKLKEADRESAALLLLDGALGEDGVERWIGSLEALRKPPKKGRAYPLFMKIVQVLTRTATENVIVTLDGEGEDGHLIEVVYNAALKRINHLDLDLHVEVSLHLEKPNTQGLATVAEAKALERLQTVLQGRLGNSALTFARETSEGHCVLHFFAAESSGAFDVFERFEKENAVRRPKVTVRRDEEWDALHQWQAEDEDS